MPSLRQRMTTYLRQLSFINEPRDEAQRNRRPRTIHPGDASDADGCFVTRFLDGRMVEKPKDPDTQIMHGKEPQNLPDLQLLLTRHTTLTAACTGPDDGLASIRRSRLHLSAGPEIDFIDTSNDQEPDDDIDMRRSAPTVVMMANQQRRSVGAADPNANPIRGSASHSKYPNAKPKNVTINIVVSTISSGSTVDSAKIVNQMSILPNDNEPLDMGNCDSKLLQGGTKHSSELPASDERNGLVNWKLENDHAYGLSVSLYEKHSVNDERIGDPIADCFGLMVRGHSAVMAMADGVNWGEGARLAARSAVHGCLEYLDTAILGQGAGGAAEKTREVFVSLLRSFWEAHACILEVGGALSTLTAAVVLPLGPPHVDRHVVCACNVGDSFGYVYSKKHGVREFTQGSHDILNMRDMRDALGALGPVSGNQPELSNLTLSMTIVEPGDIVFLTSDGISDNFDPVVGKFAEPFTENRAAVGPGEAGPVPGLAPKRQNRSTSAIVSTATAAKSVRPQSGGISRPPLHPNQQKSSVQRSETQRSNRTRPSVSIKEASPSKPSPPKSSAGERPKFLRSHTVIEPRSIKPVAHKISTKLPMVTGQQRHALTLLRLEDLLCYGINGTHRPCPSARKLCHLLVDFAKMITSARRGLLEQRELYYRMVTDPVSGVRSEVELNKLQYRSARKRVVDGSTFSQLPGKLDHASVVAFTVESSVPPSVRNVTQRSPAGVPAVETNF